MNNVALTKEDKIEDSLSGPVREVLAQKGGTAILPCKLTDLGAATVSRITFMFHKGTGKSVDK